MQRTRERLTIRLLLLVNWRQTAIGSLSRIDL